MQTFPWSDLRHIKLSWGLREEGAESCAARLARYLTSIEPLHPAVLGLRSMSGSERPLYPLPVHSEDYVPLFTRLIRDENEPCRYYADGFQLQALSKFGTSRLMMLYVAVGVGREDHPGVVSPPQFGMNYVGLSTVVKDVAGEDAPIIASLKAMLLAGVEAWEPDCGGLYSHSYEQLTHDPRRRALFSEGGWAVYLAPDLASRVSPPSDGLAERVTGGGLLMMATESYFSHEIPEQRAKAEAIHAAVAGLGL